MPAMTQNVIAITGVTGFVGRHLLDCLGGGSDRLKVLVRRPKSRGDLAGVEIVEGGLDDRDALDRLCDGADAVVHCAGAIAARSRSEFFKTNRDGTANMVRAARAAGVSRFILVSSLAAREPGLSDYAASKQAGETVLREQGGRLNWSIVRPCAVYGPGDRGTLQLVRQLSRRIAFIPANPRGRVSLIHVRDLVSGLVGVIEDEARSGELHEVDDGKPDGYDWAEIAGAAGRAQGRAVTCLCLPHGLSRLAGYGGALYGRLTGRRTILNPGKVREFYHPDWVSRLNRLEKTSRWRPQIGFADGYRETVLWYREHGWM